MCETFVRKIHIDVHIFVLTKQRTMITKENYSLSAMKELTEILPSGTRIQVANKTGETIDTVANVWNGKQYKKNIVDEIVKQYRKVLKKHTKNITA